MSYYKLYDEAVRTRGYAVGDDHFVAQNAFTGVVFFVFVLTGIWFVYPYADGVLLGLIFSDNYGPAITALITAPILGVLLQGFWAFAQYRIKGHPYRDLARQEIAKRIKRAVRQSSVIPDEIKSRLRKAPDDSLFVWYYYSGASDKLVEWARRRRDFQYIGDNWTAGAVCGVVAGLIIGGVWRFNLYDSRLLTGAILVFALLTWVTGLQYLRAKMAKDVDSMELLWLCAELDQAFKQEISK